MYVIEHDVMFPNAFFSELYLFNGLLREFNNGVVVPDGFRMHDCS